ncbi:MAG: hypothetical protein GX595_00400 [Lentisphaerae bacterium]|nr:hypothetical protein [Lentisphaerota bacterium]
MNESIQAARSAAMDLLKPSAKDIAHARELHAEALVIDTYGAIPRAAVDGDALKAVVEMLCWTVKGTRVSLKFCRGTSVCQHEETLR